MVQFIKQAKSNQEHLQTWQDRGLVSRPCNKEHDRSIKIPTSNAIQWLHNPVTLSNSAIRYEKRSYMLLVAMQTLLYKISPNSTWAKRLKDLIEQYPSLSGTAVSRDFVEFPSQFLENFAYEAAILKRFGFHYETGEPISEELMAKIKETKNYQAALGILRQVEFSLFDFTLHQNLF